MRKYVLPLITIAAITIATVFWLAPATGQAQTTLFGTTPTSTPNNPTAPAGPATPAKPMSQQDFINAVNAQSQQTQNRISQQLNQQIASQPHPAGAPITSAPSNPASLNGSSTSISNPTPDTTPAPSQPIATPTQPAPAIPAAANAPPPPAYSAPTSNYGVSNAPTPAGSSSPQPGGYTGFGTGENANQGSRSNTSSGSSNGNNAGWGIKY